jgi:hypothetical protein
MYLQFNESINKCEEFGSLEAGIVPKLQWPMALKMLRIL